MLDINEDKVIAIGHVLNDKNRPLKERFRALFTLKNIGGPFAIEQIKNCFNDSSALLKHELAYCLGQMQDVQAIPVLIDILKNTSQEPMVRHEAGEALGAIGDPTAIPILETYTKDSVIEVAETCQLALDRLKWLADLHNTSEGLIKSPYASVDPAPPAESKNVEILKKSLLDENASLFDRYRAMFSLRNLNTKESIDALGAGLKAGSALFRHEIAFVLGQMQEEVSVPYLRDSLEDPEENEMVRHECAEALGAIATPDCMSILNRYLEDNKRVVRESCVIALDMCDYENSPEFQYADTLTKVSS
ncbi:deoxyhypusine hydroxylase [Cephus cinctus]|uniref:Deoxyhypusine hydroxylase n=1 Tax=Cephus cinctus TaxID=211228 RepID=A0AAJ7FVD9_CEPCN|nr:deoxyhypusine hydroxylase [Cephus cinctus]